MADKKPGAPSSGTAEQAMNRVLAAERDAGQAIADCETGARNIVQTARQHTNRISSRTSQRITLLQMRSAQHSAATLRHLQEKRRSDGDQANEPLDDASVSACMEEVAEALTCAVLGGTRDTDTGR